MRIMGEALSYIHTKNVRKGYERELGERLMPYKDMLRHVEMAYEIVVYPRTLQHRLMTPYHEYADLEGYYGVETKEKIADAKAHPGEDIEENPHRAPITLNLAERDLLVMLTHPRGLPCDPDKMVYRYSDLDGPETEHPRAKYQREGKEYKKGLEHLRRFRKPAKERP